MSEPTTADVLRAARELYAVAPSHASGGMHPRKGTVCVVMALFQVGGVGRARAAEELRESAGCRSLIGWNADNSTETVLAAFDRAIEACS